MIDADELAPAYRELGTLYANRGDTAKASQAYRRFLQLWKDADPELGPQVTWVRGRLAQLRPDVR